jgi:hypothetical protein
LSEPTPLLTNNKKIEKTTKTIEYPDKNKKTFEIKVKDQNIIKVNNDVDINNISS